MPSLPEPIQQASGAFDSLPGVGPRAALRYAFWLVSQPKEVIETFARAMSGLAHILHCSVCHQWTTEIVCNICRDGRRDRTLVCVVATSDTIRAIEDTGAFSGMYHVLGGTIDPIEGRTPDTIAIAPLIERVRATVPPIQEILLAFDADIPGDTTALYLTKQLSAFPVKVSRLARGLPTGAALEYADALTLADAITHRTN